MLGRSELQVKRIKAEYWGNYVGQDNMNPDT
jgi:hypothetical protein